MKVFIHKGIKVAQQMRADWINTQKSTTITSHVNARINVIQLNYFSRGRSIRV